MSFQDPHLHRHREGRARFLKLLISIAQYPAHVYTAKQPLACGHSKMQALQNLSACGILRVMHKNHHHDNLLYTIKRAALPSSASMHTHKPMPQLHFWNPVHYTACPADGGLICAQT